MPTLVEHLEACVQQPEAAQRLEALAPIGSGIVYLQRTAEAYLQRPEAKRLSEALEGLGTAIMSLSHAVDSTVQAVAQHMAELPPSPGYEPWYIEQGCDPLLARMMAKLKTRIGHRIARDRARLPAVTKAIRYLASPHRKVRTLASRVQILLTAWNETSVIETNFSWAGRDDFEFVRLLENFDEKDEAAVRQLREIAAEVVPHLPKCRGRRISAAMAGHEAFLRDVHRFKPSMYTWNGIDDEFTDSVTAATRREFNAPDFDPRPACRRFKAHPDWD